MKVYTDERAAKELRKFDKKVQGKFKHLRTMIENDERLPGNKKKILKGTKLIEYRIEVNTNIFRALAVERDEVLILVYFQKKTYHTPIRYIQTAQRRLRNYNY